MSDIFRIQPKPRPIQEGDVGVVIAKDRTFFVFNAHDNFDPDNLTEIQIAQGEALEALTLALRFPEIMEVLKRMANDPALIRPN